MKLTQFLTEVRQRLERANPENRIFTDYADNRKDLETALAIIEKLNAAVEYYANESQFGPFLLARQARDDVQKMLGEKK